VKTINNESFSYTLPLTTIVSDLKRMLRDSTTIDIPRQRLIFRGRVLQDHVLLTDYSIACGNVLHMVARPTADTEAVDEAARNAMQSTASHPAATSSSYGISQFSNEVNNLQGNPSVAEGNQLQQLARNELELLDQLLSGQPRGQQEPDAALHSQHQHDLQRQQLFSSDISSYSFQSTSRFAVVPSSTSAGAPSSSSLAPTPFSPTTSTSPRPHVNSSSDSIERIRQGLLTMETIISTFEADTTASTLQPSNLARISVPVMSAAANSNSETTSTITGKSIRQSGSSLSSTAESSLSETNCVTDDVGIKVEDALQLNNGNSILKDSVVFEKAAGVGLNNSIHSTGSEGQRETETETQITNSNKDDTSSSDLGVKPIDVSKGAQESLCSLVEADLSSDSPSTTAANINLKSESETETLTGKEKETVVETETEALKGAVSEPDQVQLKEETPSRPRDSQNQSQSQSQREVKRQYFVGQWVDVKDTVSQWLEATVMMIDEDGQRVFIHYNGW
jgi:Ubiquitin family